MTSVHKKSAGLSRLASWRAPDAPSHRRGSINRMQITGCLALFFSLLLVSAAVSFAASDIPLVYGSWVYRALWRLEARGLTGPVFASSRPFDRDQVSSILSQIDKELANNKLELSKPDLELIKKLHEEFGVSGEASNKMRSVLFSEERRGGDSNIDSLSLWTSAIFHPASSITLYEEIDIGRGREPIGSEGNTASSRINTWAWDYTADFHRAYIRYHRPRFEMLFGRQSLQWGPGHTGSLVLSENSPPLDMVLVKAKLGPVKATAFSAMLDKMWAEHGNPSYRYLANRYLSGHRIDWMITDKAEFGISELVLYGGQDRGMEFQYMNPLIPYYATQWNSTTIRRDDNVMACADLAIIPIQRLKVYGQFLVDDFSYSGGDPNALAYLAGLYLTDPFGLPGSDTRLEYTRINTWTYTHLEPDKQFTHYGWIIGHHLGPDADQLLLEPSIMFKTDAYLKLTYAFERLGSHTVADRFSGEDYKKMPFPSGNVQRRHIVGLRFAWEPVDGPFLDVSWQHAFVMQGTDSSQEDNISTRIGWSKAINLFR